MAKNIKEEKQTDPQYAGAPVAKEIHPLQIGNSLTPVHITSCD
jgi:hypothetical protein